MTSSVPSIEARSSAVEDGVEEPGDRLTREIERLLTVGIGVTVRAIDATTGAADLTLPQWRVLVIGSQPGRLRIGDLAAQLGVSVPSASRLVRRMERRQLVSARRGEDDRRSTNVELTPAGRALVAAIVARRRELIAAAVRRHRAHEPADAVTLLSSIADQLAELA